jgi:hypothetical protein
VAYPQEDNQIGIKAAQKEIKNYSRGLKSKGEDMYLLNRKETQFKVR